MSGPPPRTTLYPVWIYMRLAQARNKLPNGARGRRGGGAALENEPDVWSLYLQPSSIRSLFSRSVFAVVSLAKRTESTSNPTLWSRRAHWVGICSGLWVWDDHPHGRFHGSSTSHSEPRNQESAQISIFNIYFILWMKIIFKKPFNDYWY